MPRHYPPAEPGRMPPLSMAVRTGNLLFVSGVGPHDENFQVAAEDFGLQMRAVLNTLDKVLSEAGTARDRIVKVNVLLTRERDIPLMNRLYAEWLGGPPWPARTTAVVLALPVPQFLLEIECVAEIG